MSYNFFADYYDEFTENVDYKARAEYFAEIFKKNGIDSGILLDLACGTGELSFELEKLGFDVIGTDLSTEMLSKALAKKIEKNSSAAFLNQDMTELDLYGTIKAAVCTLDSINHLDSIEKVKKAFSKVSLFTESGGVFIFDVNTEYKHTEVLADNAFVYESDDCFLCWQNELCEDKSVNIYLDFFVPEGEIYRRESEYIKEYYYSDEALADALKHAGFELEEVYDDLSFSAPSAKSERKIFVCKKV